MKESRKFSGDVSPEDKKIDVRSRDTKFEIFDVTSASAKTSPAFCFSAFTISTCFNATSRVNSASRVLLMSHYEKKMVQVKSND